ncbi:LysR substrate-binding domain-containing protein [Chelatococcus asaccharovorans]|uniref:DNA-binding transcriptional LysR family regulator n=1 Tax=Chelatococcus asaccharovorans TaxID=28210 RepID=A0A2V3U003_9HYPH|nr:LysR substrate-binding domain-containing protein [Chelatococcus asaccharovorans]MBS7707727.1 LysR family transcriptional regulator [Chelatococcus asaccharovorans]PXW55304.1 DNA-binding transcriptional LysR family regulator [Chelatococcus asaccharovorans]
MNFRQIEAFCALMACGTASRAADILNVTQPAISRSIAELEREVGFPLFTRERRRMIPTPEGQMLYRESEDAFAGIERIRMTAARIRNLGSGDLRIASLPALGDTLAPRAVKLFQEANPHVPVTLRVVGSSSVRELILSGEYHIGIVSNEIDLRGVERQLFERYAAVCVMTASHPLTAKGLITAEDLAGQAFVLPSPEDASRIKIDQIFGHRNIRLRVVAEAYSSATVCALVCEGVGIGIVNPLAAEKYIRSGLVVRPFLPEVVLMTSLIYPLGLQNSIISRQFSDVLRSVSKGIAPSGDAV